MSNTQGFVALSASADKLRQVNIPFAVILDRNEVKAFVVNKTNWHRIESMEVSSYAGTNFKPLLSMTDTLQDTINELDWVVVGSHD